MDNVNVEAAPAKKSSASLVLGIIGFCLGLPGALCMACLGCAGAAVAGAASEAAYSAQDAEQVAELGGNSVLIIIFSILALVGVIMGFAACFSSKKAEKAKSAGVLMLIAAVLILIASIGVFNILGLIAGILYLIGGCLAFKNANA
jgi:heme/copper-type cytochrome/quinol oxidase subunit 2